MIENRIELILYSAEICLRIALAVIISLHQQFILPLENINRRNTRQAFVCKIRLDMLFDDILFCSVCSQLDMRLNVADAINSS